MKLRVTTSILEECTNKDTNNDGGFHIITSEDSSVENDLPDVSINSAFGNTTDFYPTNEDSTNIFSNPSIESIRSNRKNCEVVLSEFLDGKEWNSSLPVTPNVSQANTNEIQEGVTWDFELDEHNIPSVRWTGSEVEFKQLSGLLVRLRVRCADENSYICAMVKVEGIKTYTIFLPPRSTSAPPKTAKSTMEYDTDMHRFVLRVTPEPTTTTPVYNPLTPSTAGNGTTDILTGLVADEELEVIVTGVCVGVAIIMCLWMTCFAIEKRVQTTRTRGEGKTSSSRTYTHAVSSCRRNLMENYDMPMIKVAKPKDDDDSSGSDGQRKKTDSSSSSIRSGNEDADAEAEDTASPSSSGQRAESGSFSESKRKSSIKSPPSYLDLPTKPGKEGFGKWRPVAKHGAVSPIIGSGEGKLLKGILKKSTPYHKPAPIIKNSILKKPKIDPHLKGHSPPFSRRFVRTGSKRNQQNQSGDYLELQTMNAVSTHGTSPTKNEGRHKSSFKNAVMKARKTRFKFDELDDFAKRKEDKKHVVITCEVHHVDETPNGHREGEDNDENVKCSELEPLTKESHDVNQLKRNCYEMRWAEDTDPAQTATV